jgi:hypothetical protein
MERGHDLGAAGQAGTAAADPRAGRPVAAGRAPLAGTAVMALNVGDQVTIMPPFGPYDDIRVAMQRYARIAEVLPDEQYMVWLGSVMPPDQKFGPFSAERLKAGWRDKWGRWL